MSYQVLSRKWRPQRFDKVVGQNHITRTLQNAIGMDRVAHGYLFAGPRGVGKTTIARILAKVLSCENPQDKNPCNKCTNCRDINRGSSLDVQELDGASNRGIDEIRGLREAVKYPPNNNKYRIYIIDEIHMLTREAFNALLKTLEEPPEHIVFIMATTDAYKVPTTILSRTQKFDFKPISVNNISTYLKGVLDNDKLTYKEEGIYLIAQKADGSLRDSLSLLDKVIAYADDTLDIETIRDVLGIIEENVFLDIMKLISEKNHQELIATINKLLNDGFAIPDFICGFNGFLRNCMVHKSNDSDFINLSEESTKWLESDCRFSLIDILRMLEISLQFESNLKNIPQPKISLEALFMKLVMLDNSIDISQVLSGKKNLASPIKKSSSATQPLTKPAQFEEKKTHIRAAKDDSNNESENISDPKDENNTTLSLEIIEKSWKDVLGELEKYNSKIAHFLEDAKLTKFDGTHLWIELLNGHRFHQKTLEKDIDKIEAAINSILSNKIRIKFQLKENTEDKANQKKHEKTEHPLFDKVLETFEGEIIR